MPFVVPGAGFINNNWATAARWHRGAPSLTVAQPTSPLTIFGSNLIAWYKADTGVYHDAGITLCTNGQTCQQWNDQSGNSHHIKNTSGANLTTFLSSGFNTSFPTVQFGSGGSTYLNTSGGTVGAGVVSVANSGVGTAFIVAQYTSGTFSRIVTWISGTATGIDANDTGSTCWILQDSTNANLESFDNNSAKGTLAIAAATPFSWAAVYDGVNLTSYNFNASTSASSADAFGGFTSNLGMISLGMEVASGYTMSTGGGGFLTGLISEVVIVNVAANSSQRSSMHSYFVNKWSVP